MPFPVFWCVVSLMVAYVAKRRGYGFFRYFMLSFLLTPILAGTFLLFSGKKNNY